jgi:hypothetical protein
MMHICGAMGMMLTYAVTSTNECYNYIGVMLMMHI